MTDVDTSHRATEVVRKYRSIGLIGGFGLGALAGVMVAGPHFSEWALGRTAMTIGGATFLGGLIGYIAAEIAIAREASGCGPGIGGSSQSLNSGGPGCGGGAEGGDE